MKYALLIIVAALLMSGCASQTDCSNQNSNSVHKNVVSEQKNVPVPKKRETLSARKKANISSNKPKSHIGTFCGDSNVDDDF